MNHLAAIPGVFTGLGFVNHSGIGQPAVVGGRGPVVYFGGDMEPRWSILFWNITEEDNESG